MEKVSKVDACVAMISKLVREDGWSLTMARGKIGLKDSISPFSLWSKVRVHPEYLKIKKEYMERSGYGPNHNSYIKEIAKRRAASDIITSEAACEHFCMDINELNLLVKTSGIEVIKLGRSAQCGYAFRYDDFIKGLNDFKLAQNENKNS